MDKNKGTTEQSGNLSENNVNKIIRLKTAGTRRVQMKMDLMEKKAALTASILSVVAIATFFNQKIVSHFDTNSNSRNIASLNEQAEYEFEWQKELAQKLSEKSSRSIASFGEQPSKLDEIRFGVLEGKYSFSYKNDLISEIKFQETANADRPKYISNIERFLIENNDVLVPSVSVVKVLKQQAAYGTIEKTLELYDSNNNNLGLVVYTADEAGRFLSMKFQPSSAL